ncbi:MAG TPA: hypothetical protein VJP78_08985 [Thermoleophilia bacterium]|nr:hypothetical protein [Thermoleophilia bacterium]
MQHGSSDLSNGVLAELAYCRRLEFQRWRYEVQGVERPARHGGRSWLTAEDVDFLVSGDQAVEDTPEECGYADEGHYREEGRTEGEEPPDVPPDYAVSQ